MNSFTFVSNDVNRMRLKQVDPLVRLSVSAKERALAAMAEEDDSKNSGAEAIDLKELQEMMLGGRPFPLSMVVGQDVIKQSLLLSSVNSRMGGVVISGGKGTAKSCHGPSSSSAASPH